MYGGGCGSPCTVRSNGTPLLLDRQARMKTLPSPRNIVDGRYSITEDVSYTFAFQPTDNKYAAVPNFKHGRFKRVQTI